MIEFDHSTPPQPEPEPAIPILASHLLRLEEKQRTRFTRDGRPERLSTHCENIDEILGGGAERGIVMGISAEGTEGRLISLHLLASALLSHLPSTSQDNQRISTVATIIDTVGSFPLTLLAQILKSRIATSHAHSVQPDENQLDKVKIEQLLQQCLEMVAISRVFDIEGLWEVLGEIGHEVPTSSANEPSEPPENKGVEPIQSSPDWPEINDSQESISISSNHDYDLQSPPPPNRTENKTTDSGTEIIIIDTLSQIITELFSRKDKASAHNLLTLLSLHIQTQSRTNNILTLLLNTATPSKTPSYQNQPQHQPQPNQESPPHAHVYKQSKKSNPQSTSLFVSNPLKPALGKLFAQFPSLHVFCSKLPKRGRDAEVLYGRDRDEVRDEEGGVQGSRGVEFCTVIEVLTDECPDLDPKREIRGGRFAEREGRWCAVEFEVVHSEGQRGGRFKGAFEMEGEGMGRGGVDVSVKGSTETEVGNVAKIYGFGGRRV